MYWSSLDLEIIAHERFAHLDENSERQRGELLAEIAASKPSLRERLSQFFGGLGVSVDPAMVLAVKCAEVEKREATARALSN